MAISREGESRTRDSEVRGRRRRQGEGEVLITNDTSFQFSISLVNRLNIEKWTPGLPLLVIGLRTSPFCLGRANQWRAFWVQTCGEIFHAEDDIELPNCPGPCPSYECQITRGCT